MSEYPVENIRPALHGDALKNCQHGEEDVVEVCDAAVGAFPLSPALRPIPFTKPPAAGKRTRRGIIFHNETWSREQKNAGQALSQQVHEVCIKSVVVQRAQTCAHGVARLVHPADKKLQADDGVDDDDKHDQHTDVQKGDHGFHDGVQHNL